jgi:hypothetical protein
MKRLFPQPISYHLPSPISVKHLTKWYESVILEREGSNWKSYSLEQRAT